MDVICKLLLTSEMFCNGISVRLKVVFQLYYFPRGLQIILFEPITFQFRYYVILNTCLLDSADIKFCLSLCMQVSMFSLHA